jgi:hypothetical protein
MRRWSMHTSAQREWAHPSNTLILAYTGTPTLQRKRPLKERPGISRRVANGLKSFGELFRRLGLAVGDLAIWQSPLALLTKWHRKEFA